MNLNRFSIFNRLSHTQIELILWKFKISIEELFEKTQTENFDPKVCSFTCRLLGYSNWYPKYHPRGMGKKYGWASEKEGNRAIKNAKKRKKLDKSSPRKV